MGMPDPRLESLADSIARGEEPSRDELQAATHAASHPGVANNLVILAEISRFHRMVHGHDEVTIERPAAQPDVPTASWGHLQIRGRLGRGGFGEVLRAWDPSLEREVALKLLRGDLEPGSRASQQLVKEARLLAKVRHPNVVTVYGVEQHDGRDGYWMERIEGQDLERVVAEHGPMSAGEAAQVGVSLCSALAALHEAGLVHRDVKANNVVRERGGRIVLMDFGSAVAPHQASAGAQNLSGTPIYMAPELLAGQPPSRQSDLYALGVLLFHLATGSYPFEARTLDALRSAHEQRKGRHVRDVRADLPQWFCEVVQRATDPNPDARFQTAGELERALTHTAAPLVTPTRATRSGARTRGWLAAAAIAVVAMVAVVVAPRLRPAQAPIVADARLFALQQGAAAPLGDGATVTVGDPLWLELQISRPAYVYVLNRDDTGEVNLLFPLSGYDLQNPLPGGQSVELPGRMQGIRKGWRVSSRGGREEFLIIASAKRLDAFEKSVQGLPQAGGEAERMALVLGGSQVHELVRGVAGISDLPEEGTGHSAADDVFDAAQRLGDPAPATRGIWVRKLSLENPR